MNDEAVNYNTVYVLDDEELIPQEDLSALYHASSIEEFCAQESSAMLVIGCGLLVASLLIVAIRIAWAYYAKSIAEFYRMGENWSADDALNQSPRHADENAKEQVLSSPRPRKNTL